MRKISYALAISLCLFLFPLLSHAQTATITWTDVHQTIDGFGASDAFCVNQSGYNTCSLTDAQADLFFSPTASGGIGLSFLRSEVPDDGSCATTCSIPDSVTMAKAIARGARVWATPWSPPASMKSNSSVVCNPGSGVLNSGSYSSYATYLKNYVQQLQSMYSIPLYALSVQNEPDFCPTYDGALWTATNFHDFIKNNLGPAFATAGLTTKILMPEPEGSNDLAAYADTTMNDAAARAFVGIAATHDYQSPGTANPVNYTNGGKPLWETETSDFNTADATITSGLLYAKEVYDWLTSTNLTAWHAWWMVNNNSDNEGLIQSDGTITKRFYAIGNFSRFVRPGWVRIGSTLVPTSGVFVSAFKDPGSSGNFAIIAENTNGGTSAVNFNLSGFGPVTTVTPWLTSASANLAAQSNVSVVGQVFSVTLPASSITTYVGTMGSGSIGGGGTGGGGGVNCNGVASPWNGIINCTRAAPWSRANVGVPGGIPSASWTQTGVTINAYGTAGSPGPVSTINNALTAGCGSNKYVLLGPGIFSLDGGVVINCSGVVLKAASPNTTTLQFPNGGSTCFAAVQDLCLTNPTGLYPGAPATLPGGTNVFSWTAGFTQGATSITIASVGSTGIVNGDMIVLDQANDLTDNGGEIICDNNTNFPCFDNLESPGYAGRQFGGDDYSQEQYVRVISGCASTCTGSGPFTLTISPGLYANNWNGTGKVGGFFLKPIHTVGYENLTVDDSNNAPCIARTFQCGVMAVQGVDGWWIKNVRSIKGQRNHLWTQGSSHGEVRDSYFFGTQAAASESYGWEVEATSDSLFENNILQQIASPTIGPGAASGNIYAYNFWINDYYTGASGDFMQNAYSSHDPGNSFNLYEGNQGNAITCDSTHGSSALDTFFRNWMNGRDYNTAGGPGAQPHQDTLPVALGAHCRGYNIIGGVHGTPGYHMLYESYPPSNMANYANCNITIFDLGGGGGVCNNLGAGGVLNDTVVRNSLMRWGNYDVATGTIRWDATESSPGAYQFIAAQSTPASHVLPMSLYLNARPSWWGSMPFPATGPDVTGGSGPAGLTYPNPAAVCYKQTMQGPTDGGGNVLPFDATNCYGTTPPPTRPNPPTGLSAVVQ